MVVLADPIPHPTPPARPDLVTLDLKMAVCPTSLWRWLTPPSTPTPPSPPKFKWFLHSFQRLSRSESLLKCPMAVSGILKTTPSLPLPPSLPSSLTPGHRRIAP